MAILKDIFNTLVDLGDDGHFDVFVTPGAEESIVREEHGPPPFPGAVFNRDNHHWEKPNRDSNTGGGKKGKWARIAHAIKDAGMASKAAVIEKLRGTLGGRAVLKLGSGGVTVARVLEHKLALIGGKVRDVCAEAARQRGMSEEGAKTLQRCLYAADFVGGYGLAIGAHATGAPILAIKASAFLPSLSVAYLMYSTARDPVATWKAAKKVVAKTSLNPLSKHEGKATILDELADTIAAAPESEHDGLIAIWYASIQRAEGDMAGALDIFEQAIKGE